MMDLVEMRVILYVSGLRFWLNHIRSGISALWLATRAITKSRSDSRFSNRITSGFIVSFWCNKTQRLSARRHIALARCSLEERADPPGRMKFFSVGNSSSRRSIAISRGGISEEEIRVIKWEVTSDGAAKSAPT